ncbi:GNAT family N-acetyltransferase [Streptomyces sp. NPDC006879]|uniref:GNAT family N-acetyltransferase n=1 Tax=Streptomyces sp. NPDC006879 TaxID=3364767 RepID=UPI0036BBDE72
MTTSSIDRLEQLEQYYDSVPRRGGARAEDFGPLTLFVQEGSGWPYYARPTPGTAATVTSADVERVLARQRALGIPEAFEWVDETTPTLRAAAEASGLTVHAHPLMILDPEVAPARPHPAVRMLDPGDPFLHAALTVPQLAFAAPGTATGPVGTAELATRMTEDLGNGRTTYVSARLAAGSTAVAAYIEDGTVLSSGQHQPVGRVCEIVGIGTLPAARRRGLALAVTSALVSDARARGMETVFLSAGDEDVARIYARAGFRRVGTALIAEPAAP